MRNTWWAVILVMVVGGLMGSAEAAEPDAALLKEQALLDAGNDLSSRARRALFRARTRQDEGEFEDAAAVMSTWLAGDPAREHHLLRFNLAVSYFGLERPADALVSLEQAVTLAPRYARAWLRLGEAAYELKKYRQAGEAFVRAYDLSPDHRPEILYYAGVSLLSGDRAGQAFGSLARLIDNHPDTARLDWYQALLAAAGEASRPEHAAPYLDRLLAARPDDPDAWELAYRFHAGQTDYEQAAAHLTVADYLQDLSRDELIQLGDLYAAIGVPLQAAHYYELAFTAETEPGPDEYRKLATAWLSAHEPAAARTTLDTALAARATTRLWALKGDLEYMAEDYAAALAAFAHGIELDPDFGRGHLMMGYCAYELGREKEALCHLARAAEFPAQSTTARGLVDRLNAR